MYDAYRQIFIDSQLSHVYPNINHNEICIIFNHFAISRDHVEIYISTLNTCIILVHFLSHPFSV